MSKHPTTPVSRLICFGSARGLTNAPGFVGNLEENPIYEYPV